MSSSIYYDGLWDGRQMVLQLLFCVCVYGGAASRIYSKQYTALLCRSHLTFSLGISLKSSRCNHTVVLTQPQLNENPVLFCQIDKISAWSTTCHNQNERSKSALLFTHSWREKNMIHIFPKSISRICGWSIPFSMVITVTLRAPLLKEMLKNTKELKWDATIMR